MAIKPSQINAPGAKFESLREDWRGEAIWD